MSYYICRWTTSLEVIFWECKAFDRTLYTVRPWEIRDLWALTLRIVENQHIICIMWPSTSGDSTNCGLCTYLLKKIFVYKWNDSSNLRCSIVQQHTQCIHFFGSLSLLGSIHGSRSQGIVGKFELLILVNLGSMGSELLVPRKKHFRQGHKKSLFKFWSLFLFQESQALCTKKKQCWYCQILSFIPLAFLL